MEDDERKWMSPLQQGGFMSQRKLSKSRSVNETTFLLPEDRLTSYLPTVPNTFLLQKQRYGVCVCVGGSDYHKRAWIYFI